jgi:glycosyltransferase involved in cell wall biosynthesis
MNNVKITFIVSTYNRPDTLKAALTSLRIQTYCQWKALVIGDCCDERTKTTVDILNDSRFTFINLPVRCGEQSGPNSVGIALADTEYIGFLNQDDILLPDHVEYGLHCLEKDNADFFVGKCAIANECSKLASGVVKPLFNWIHPSNRHPAQRLGAASREAIRVFEPASGWILRTEKAKLAGFWRNRDNIFTLPPIDEWALRAWRLRLIFTFGQELTLLKITTHYLKQDGTHDGAYNYPSPEYEYLIELINRADSSEIRKAITKEVQENNAPKTTKKQKSKLDMALWPLRKTGRLILIFIRPAVRVFYYRFGVNIYEILIGPYSKIRKRFRHVLLRDVVYNRTGEILENTIDIPKLVAMTLEQMDRADD